MALWGNNDDITVATSGKVTLDYATGSVTGTATTFTNFAEGDVIRFGDKFTGTYFGDAVITGITSERVLTIASTEGLTGNAIGAGGTVFSVTQCPVYTTLDTHASPGAVRFVGAAGVDRYTYGVAAGGVDNAAGTQFETGAGWVGVQTYMDNSTTPASLRVKKEILVAMSGISTGNLPVYDSDPSA